MEKKNSMSSLQAYSTIQTIWGNKVGFPVVNSASNFSNIKTKKMCNTVLYRLAFSINLTVYFLKQANGKYTIDDQVAGYL